MIVLGGPVAAAAGLLAIGGAAKLRRPAATVNALRALRLPASGAAVRLLALAETAVAVAAVAGGGRLAWSLVGLSYLGFAGFVVVAMARGGPVSSCGCFGTPDTPATLGHVAVTLAASAAAWAAVATGPPGPLLDGLAGQPLRGVPFLVLTGCCVWFAYAALSVLPTTAALSARPR